MKRDGEPVWLSWLIFSVLLLLLSIGAAQLILAVSDAR